MNEMTGIRLHGSATWTPPQGPVTSGPDRSFDTFSAAEQQALRDKLDVLAAKGRLFRQMTPDGPLFKAEPSDAFNALERRIGLTWVVDKSSSVVETHRSTRLDAGDIGYARSESSTSEVQANHVGSPLLGWQDLTFVRTEPDGLPGATRIDNPTGTATTELSQHLASSFWHATGWILDVPTGIVTTTSHVEGTDQTDRTWKLG